MEKATVMFHFVYRSISVYCLFPITSGGPKIIAPNSRNSGRSFLMASKNLFVRLEALERASLKRVLGALYGQDNAGAF